MQLIIKTDTVKPKGNYHAFCSKAGINKNNLIKAIDERSFTVNHEELDALFKALVTHSESSFTTTIWWWWVEQV